MASFEQRGVLSGQCHSNGNAEPDSKACGEISGQFQGNVTDDGANAPVGLH
ncbi:hypothetical protein [Mesorhizobium sp. dw_380]|uniref:hypothetical protein n=1 Tax=Mesorhizobium sp. dw_380 TaxID=2812001 RepID=UPI001BDEF1EB|nr:hypothetical protein [Mesorhizobium sp. dw_380]